MSTALFVEIRKCDFFLAGTIQNGLLHLLAQLLERNFQIEVIVICHRLQHLEVELITLIPAPNGACSERQVRKGHHPCRIEKGDLTQTITLGAGARGIIEGKQTWFEFGQGITAHRATESG